MATSILRRSLLYVPASSERFLKRSLNHPCDNITYDLEDSVTADSKGSARARLRAHLAALPARPPTVSELAIRINAVSTPHALADLAALADLPIIDTVVVPKVSSASDLTFVSDVLSTLSSPERKAPIKILALIESARAIVDLASICTATPTRLDGLIFAAEDFALDLSLARTPSLAEFAYARAAVVTHARAFGLASAVDLVYTHVRDAAALAAECRGGRGVGFTGKQCIHPAQTAVVDAAFAPGEGEVERAVRVVLADEKAARAGRGAFVLGGEMVDAPVVGRARRVLELAERAGVDVARVRERLKDVEPE